MKLFIGVDVSKCTLNVFCKAFEVCVVNDQKGLKKIHSLLKKELQRGNEIAIIACEPTGGYEEKLVTFMHLIDMPIKVAHANKIRKFAGYKGILAKTDRLDARIIAEYAEEANLLPDKQLLTPEEELLANLLKRREQLINDRIRESNRLDKKQASFVLKSAEAHIKWLKKEIEKTESEIKKLKENKELNAKIQLLKSVPAVGDVVANSLVAFLPELGTEDEKKIVSLVGLAPICKDSGKYKGKRFIQGGRALVRKALYMSAISAVRHYKEMRELYLRLRNKGKLAKVALIAVARKILIVLNSVMKRKTAWVQEFAR